MEAIRCQGLSRTYGRIEALKPLDLIVERGSVFGFLGRNGAGKTTTIRLLTGLAQPTGGQAEGSGQMGLAGADGADQAAVVALIDPLAAGQFEDLLFVELMEYP